MARELIEGGLLDDETEDDLLEMTYESICDIFSNIFESCLTVKEIEIDADYLKQIFNFKQR